jgi:hypothetical protein
MSGSDPYPDAVKQAADYARDELNEGFVSRPKQFYDPTGQWNSRQQGSRRTFTGFGVHIDRENHSDKPGGDDWTVQVRMVSHPDADPLLIEKSLSADEMQNVIRAFQYRLKWFEKQGEYQPNYERKD